VRRTLLLSGALLLCACASEPRMSPTERLELYRANAGEPVTGFRLIGSVWGWRALGNSALTVWPRSNEGFLLELTAPCIDLPSATSIELTSRTTRVSTFDSVIPRGISRSGRQAPCRIRSIRPINTHVIVEVKQDMGEVDVTQRDPSLPNDPEEGETK
jgi:Family of unknown function (DUF6491)